MQRSQELLDAYRQTFQDIQDGRVTSGAEFLSSSEAVSLIGSDPNEWWTDRAVLVPALDAMFAGFREAGAKFDTSTAEAWVDGDLGFVVDQPSITVRDGRSVQIRATTIFHKEGNAWKIVHQHASIGVPNDQVDAFRAVEEAMPPP